tara:strand:- start:1186 stop:1800 length:615 start_codon:yes stop_codon:yes gene_type:complete
MTNSEITNFLENLFVYCWTSSKSDLEKLIDSVTPSVEIELHEDEDGKVLFNKYTQLLKQMDFTEMEPSNSVSFLPEVSAVMLLRSVIIEINETGINQLEEMSFEQLKSEYAHLRVKLLNNIKSQVAEEAEKSEAPSYEIEDTAQKIVDQYEDKFHEIANELGYQFLRYKTSALIKWTSSDRVPLLINLQKIDFQEVPVDPVDVN